jgi:hypothetical protein
MAGTSTYYLKEINMTPKITSTTIFWKIVFVFLLFSFQINAQFKILNNGQRRIGSGTENSINAEGNMQQPWYFSSGFNAWRPLTYSNYPLDIKWGVAGDGTNNWNNNGSTVHNPIVTNPTYDYSGFTTTNATTGDGVGVIKFTGNITVNSQLFLVENTYTLGPVDGFFRIKVKITNKSAIAATNVRLWVGTRDDWIGVSDNNLKDRGNLVNGVFTIIPTAATQAKAIKVSSGEEAILIFSNSPRAYSTFSNYGDPNPATNVDPAACDISIQNDGSYAVYARFNDLAINQSDELDWYYAAGTITEIAEIIRKVAEAASAVSNITHNSADYSYSATQSGTTSYVLVPAGSTVPTAAQVEAGVSYAGGTVISSSTIASVANTAHTYNFTGLSPNTGYAVYAVTKYNDGASDVFTSVQNTNFTTITTPVILTNFNNVNKMYFDGSYSIAAPTSNSTGAFTYTSSNTAVATISGTTVTILGAGTSTITANQAVNGNFASGSIATLLTVNTVEVLTLNGKRSNTNTNYINSNGKKGGSSGVTKNGEIKTTKTPPPGIGDSYGGGIVAYILQVGDSGYDPDVQHGLIAATTDLSSGIKWRNVTNIITGATGTAIGTGLANTNTIITSQGATATDYAAGLARGLAGGGFNDWYLPSKEELNKLYLNRVAIGGFTGTFYWSSTEGSTSSQNLNYAWGQFFTNGIQKDYDNSYGAKTTLQSVRAVRSF